METITQKQKIHPEFSVFLYLKSPFFKQNLVKSCVSYPTRKYVFTSSPADPEKFLRYDFLQASTAQWLSYEKLLGSEAMETHVSALN